MVSNVLNMSAQDLAALLAEFRDKYADDPEYQGLRSIFPAVIRMVSLSKGSSMRVIGLLSESAADREEFAGCDSRRARWACLLAENACRAGSRFLLQWRRS